MDKSLYRTVEHDSGANRQAFTVIALVSLSSGIGAGIDGLLEYGALWFLWGLIVGLASAIVGWLLWALFTYVIGVTIFRVPGTEATYGQLLRTLGFAASPGVIRLFSFLWVLGGLVSLAATIWMLIAGVIAVREALGFSTGRAIGTCVLGWIVYMLLMFVVIILVPGIEYLPGFPF